MSRRSTRRRVDTRGGTHSLYRRLAGALAIALGTLAIMAVPMASVSTPTASARRARPTRRAQPTYWDNLGIRPGLIKHVWLIILENKSYDASFTGLNNNTYLWHTLPSQGVLLKNYFATGHSSQDNYTSMVSGQAPQPDIQDDCTYYNQANGIVDMSGSLATNPNYGQWTEAAGPNGYVGSSSSHTPTTIGCVYPSSVPTLFNQYDAAGITWKGYAQDLGDTANSGATNNLTLDEDGCAAPYDNTSATTWPFANAAPTSSTADANPGSASAGGAYVPKHFPFPWFASLLDNSNDCNSSHIEPMFDNPGADFWSDLQADERHPDAYPNFVWITPDNCSDAHDAECVDGAADNAPTLGLNEYPEGGNLSGGWAQPDIPNAPTNGTGGLYAADLFLQHVIPEIESSREFKDGGLIEVTFDEGYPPFTYSNSFYNDPSTNYLHIQPGASAALATDAAGETVDKSGWPCSIRHGSIASGNCVEQTTEPTGPNTPLIQDPTTGEQLSPGPGDAASLDRPDNCIAQTPSNAVIPTPSNPTTQAVATCVLGPQAATTATNSLTKARTDSVTSSVGSSTIQDNSIKITDEGRPVRGTNIPTGAYVGPVADGPTGSCTSPSICSPSGLNASQVPIGANGSTGFEEQGYFTLVDSQGAPITLTSAVTSVTFAADCDPTPADMGGSSSPCSGLTDPFYDATHPTPGGGDTGTVLISRYIRPGSVSSVYYNHYSWLRTMEDLFGVAWASPGLDGLGHIGYAAQRGLVPFGPDVFDNLPDRWFDSRP